jgi:hypothetical protein
LVPSRLIVVVTDVNAGRDRRLTFTCDARNEIGSDVVM